MPGQRSPYTILGLKPGADRAAVEDAYRRLMKRHHPDLPSGDGDLAAEINRAYAFLNERGPLAPRLLPLGEADRPRQRRSNGRAIGLGLIVLAMLALLMVPQPLGSGAVKPLQTGPAPVREGSPDTFALHAVPDQAAVASAVASARRLQGDKDGRAADFSRECDTDLTRFPGPSLLDHCVAFDAAASMLGGDRADAQFRPEAMAARHLRAALRVSNDPVLAEERIRAGRRAAQGLLLRPAG